jgi:hypothetical protein
MRTATQARASARRQAEVEYRVLAVLTWPLFFVIALLATPFPRSWRARLPGLDAEGSVFARTRALAGHSLPFVFMG